MKIAIDISPISKKSSSLHKVRGVGSYINLLVENLSKTDQENQYFFVEDGKFPNDIDIIHYPYFDPFFLTLPATLNHNAVVTVHDLTPLVFPESFPPGIRGKIKWIIQKKRLRKAKLIITDSESSKKDIVGLAGIEESKVRVVYLAVGNAFRKLEKGGWTNYIKEKYKLPNEYLLYVGDATWNKNIPSLIKAVKKTPYKLVMVGKVWEKKKEDISDNVWNKDLKKTIEEIENDNQFIKAGFVPEEDLVRIYNLATAFIMPSTYEGFGLPLLEAMSCGCPAISSNTSSLPEIGGDAVFYFNPNDTEELEKSIVKVFKDKPFREDLSKKGLNRAKEFSINKTIEQTIKAYELI